MDLEKITALIRLVGQSGISVLELTEEGHTIRILGGPDQASAIVPAVGASEARQVHAASPTPPSVGEAAVKRLTIKASMFGTFYRAPSPKEPPFVKVGDRIEVGCVIGVIEAMKTLSPLEADRAGVVTAILVADGDVVEFGQPLIELAE